MKKILLFIVVCLMLWNPIVSIANEVLYSATTEPSGLIRPEEKEVKVLSATIRKIGSKIEAVFTVRICALDEDIIIQKTGSPEVLLYDGLGKDVPNAKIQTAYEKPEGVAEKDAQYLIPNGSSATFVFATQVSTEGLGQDHYHLVIRSIRVKWINVGKNPQSQASVIYTAFKDEKTPEISIP